MDAEAEQLIRDGRGLLGLERDEVLARLGGACARSSYGRRDDLEVVVAPPYRVYLADGVAALVYRAEPAVAPGALRLGYPDALSLPSRAGREFEHHVDPSAGVAWSDDRAHVAFVEWFAPNDLASYQAAWWTPPQFR
ncbi:MAG: hypothetical protein ABMA64_42030 [Myxococcota bacterium]